MDRSIRVNALPAKTYRFLQVNDTALTVPEELSGWELEPVSLRLPEITYYAAEGGGPSGASAGLQRADVRLELVPYRDSEEFARVPGGMGEALDALLAQSRLDAVRYTTLAGAGDGGTLVHCVSDRRGGARVLPLIVRTVPGSSLTVVLDETADSASACAAARGFLGASVRLYAERGSRIRLVHLQRLGRNADCFTDIGAFCEEGARVELVGLSLGGAEASLGVRATLAGDGSSFADRTAYYCGGRTKLDMNYIADQRGRDTASSMVFHGVLADRAEKTFRGTIDFKRGSAGSVGDEQEDTLLLSPEVVNRAVPLILCGEEDVDGRHGASIGQLSEEMLFYMRARGYAEEEARRLIVQARLLSVAREIPLEKLRWEVEQWIEKEIC